MVWVDGHDIHLLAHGLVGRAHGQDVFWCYIQMKVEQADRPYRTVGHSQLDVVPDVGPVRVGAVLCTVVICFRPALLVRGRLTASSSHDAGDV